MPKYVIGVTSWPGRKRKQLYIQEGSVVRSVAIFNSEEDAEYLLRVLKEGGLPVEKDDE